MSNFTFPVDSNQKAGAVAPTPDGNNFFIPTGGVLVPPSIGNVLNQIAANSSITQTSAVSTTAPAAGGQADLPVGGYGFLSLQVVINNVTTTSPTATLNFYASADGMHFSPVNGISKSTGSLGTNATGLSDIYTFDVRGLQQFRVIVTNYVAGDAGASISATGVAEGYAGSNHFMNLSGTSIMQPVDLQGIYYKDGSGNDAVPIYAPSGTTIGTAQNPSGNPFTVASFPMLYNNSNYDRVTNNYQYTLQASTAKTATYTTSVQTNYNARGMIVFINVTALAGTTPTLTPIIQIVDSVTNVAVPILTVSTPITAIGMYTYGIYPTALTGLTQTVNMTLPRQWNINMTIAGTTPSFTHSIGIAYNL